jgi:hypothetical protein
LEQQIYQTSEQLNGLHTLMHGSPSAREVGESGPPTPGQRLSVAATGLATTYGPTPLHKHSLEAGKAELEKIKQSLSDMVDEILPRLEQELKQAGAPWIEGQGLIR